MNWFQIKCYFLYLLKSRHWKGFGLHSPFVFDFVANLLYQQYTFYDFEKIDTWREELSKIKQKIKVSDFGSGSSVSTLKKRKVGNIVINSSISKRYGEVLYRMINFFGPSGILELGTAAGISTLYLGLPKSSAKLVTIEGCADIIYWAEKSFKHFKMKNIELLCGKFTELIPEALKMLPSLDFLFIDGDHNKKSTLEYFNHFLKYVHNDTVIVFDDIHWSQEMEDAWNEIINNPKITVSIDIFRLGIIFFKKECQKQHFIVRF